MCRDIIRESMLEDYLLGKFVIGPELAPVKDYDL